MWHIGGVLAAAQADPPHDARLAIILAIIGLLSAVAVATVGGFFTLKAARARTEPSPPSPAPTVTTRELDMIQDLLRGVVDDVEFLRERTAVHGQRIVDIAGTVNMQDRRIDLIERAKDREHPGWREYR